MKRPSLGVRSQLHALLLVFAGVGFLLSHAPRVVTAAEPSWASLEENFRSLPMEARRLTGPLFWLHGDESPERLQMYVEKVAEGGNGSFTAESRPHVNWLQEGWYRDLAICLEAAKKHDLKMWIFDEKWWPSGEVAGLVPEQYGSKRLVAVATNVTGPGRFVAAVQGGKRGVGIVAGRIDNGAVEPASLVDLSKNVRDETLSWDVPAGTWSVMQFSWTTHKSGNRYLLDGASQDCVDWYLRTVYQPHYDRFKADFGRDIVGFFYDEPETHGDWGTEVMKVLKERKVDWKKALVAWKFKLAGEEQAAAKYQYHEAFAEAWGRTLFGGITRWCREHRVKSIGHFLEHGNGYLNPDICAGNMVPLLKYSDMGGIDAVFDQFVWGKRVTRDSPIWQTPKLGSSVTHAYGKPDDISMVEIFGARGQDLTYPEMKWWTDHMHVSGINFMIPHSFNPRAPRDTDCPPYFYNGGFEPRWPLYRVYADYTSRLSLLLTGGRHVCPVALLYLGSSAHVGKHSLPHEISESLQDALFDCDWLPYEVFENDTRVAGNQLRLRQESYKILIVPAVEVIPQPTLAKVKRFFDAGGMVVTHGFTPTKSATLGVPSTEIQALAAAIWGPEPQPGLTACQTNSKGGRSYLLPGKPTPEQLQQAFTGDAKVRPTLEILEGESSHWLHVIHRVKSGRDVFFVANQNHTGDPRRFRFRLRAEGIPECWDAMRNEITWLPHVRQGDIAEVALSLHPNESVALVFQPKPRPLPPRIDPAFPRPGGRTLEVARVALPARPEPELKLENANADRLQNCSWIWYPEGNPAQAAPPGRRYFRKQIQVPAERRVVKAIFLGAADNAMTVFINRKPAGGTDQSVEGWRNPVELDVTALFQPGINQVALSALNATDQPNPAGAIGFFQIDFDQGAPLTVPLDASWKAGVTAPTGWMEPGFDDSSWAPSKNVAAFGQGPWGRLTVGMLTLSPAKADPFAGHFTFPPDIDRRTCRAILEMDALKPEEAARVTVNGRSAGGFIGAPLRLDITRHLQPGENQVLIEPFSPVGIRVRLEGPL